MTCQIRVNRILNFFLTIALSSAAYHYSTGSYNLWMMIWLAPLPLCIYALDASFVSTICAAFSAYFIGTSAFLAGSSYPIVLITAIIYGNILGAIAFSIVLAIFRYITIQYKHWTSSLIFASGFTAYEFITSLFSRHGTISSIAYTQITNLPIIQIASLTGIWGITFLLSLIPAGIATAWHFRQNRPLSNRILILPFSLLVLTIVFGAYHLHLSSSGPSIKIGIVAEPTTLEQYFSLAANKDPRQVLTFLEKYTRDIEILAQKGANVVLLPEKIFTLSDSSQYDLLQHFRNTAKQYGTYLIVGLNCPENDNLFNSAFVFSPSGEILLRYDKQHLLPPFENKFTPGSSLGLIKTSSLGTWGIEICKDMDFIHPALDYSRQGINIMFVPALDFHDDAWSHGRVAIMRGVEGNYAIARAGQWGLLTLTDSRGRIIGMSSTDAAQAETLLTGELQLGEGESVYSKLGDWFGWLCIIAFTILSWPLFLASYYFFIKLPLFLRI